MSPIQKHRHLQFHVEAYSHETYLLAQRLLKFLKVLEREHRRDPEIKAIKELCAALGEFVRGAFKKVAKLRSSHVHEARLTDKSIDRLGSIDLYARALGDLGARRHRITRLFRQFYQAEYLKSRRSWKKWIASGNVATRELLDKYFEGLSPVILDEGRNTIRYPIKLNT